MLMWTTGFLVGSWVATMGSPVSSQTVHLNSQEIKRDKEWGQSPITPFKGIPSLELCPTKPYLLNAP